MQPPKARSKMTWRILRQAPVTIKISICVIISMVLLALFASQISRYDPADQDLIGRLVPPMKSTATGEFHLLGTDHLGRDMLARVIYGTRISIGFAVLGTVFGLVLGATLGIIAGFLRGRVDQAIMFLVDVQLSLPFIILCLVAIAIFGRGLVTLIPLIGLVGWDTYARYARASSLAARESQFVLASRAVGASNGHLMRRHILPNVTAPIIVVATLNVTGIILLESSLSFLGLGVQPPTPSWGSMISEGRQYLGSAWWIAVFPGLAMAMTTLAVALLGDWLRDMLDPTTRTD